jgi:hypothetical protein
MMKLSHMWGSCSGCPRYTKVLHASLTRKQASMNLYQTDFRSVKMLTFYTKRSVESIKTQLLLRQSYAFFFMLLFRKNEWTRFCAQSPDLNGCNHSNERGRCFIYHETLKTCYQSVPVFQYTMHHHHQPSTFPSNGLLRFLAWFTSGIS